MSNTNTIETSIVLAVMRHFNGEKDTCTKAVASAYEHGITHLPVDFYELKKVFDGCGFCVVATIFKEVNHLYELYQFKAL